MNKVWDKMKGLEWRTEKAHRNFRNKIKWC